MEDSLKRLILKLFDIGAIEFGAFKFKHHEKDPDAPLAPIKINLRTPNHPTDPGKLPPSLVFEIAVHFVEIIERKNIDFDYIAGIPRAGEPFAEVMAKILNKPLIRAEKVDGKEKRKIGKVILPFPVRPGQRVLLIDDVITKGNSKQEAIDAFETAGLKIAAIILLVDREEGGMEYYQKLGYRLVAAATITEVLALGFLESKISLSQYQDCLEYLELSQKGGF